MEKRSPPVAIVVAALLAVYIVWGSTYYAMAVALESLPPFLMAGPRFVVAGASMYAFLRLRGAPAPTRDEWIGGGRVGFLLLTCGNGAVAIAEQSVSTSVAAVIVASMPIWAAVMGRFVGARSDGREWAGLALGFAGVVLLNLDGSLQLDTHGLVLLVAPITWAAGSVASTKWRQAPGAMASAVQMIAAGITMLLIAFVTGERVTHPPSARAIGAVLYLAVFGSIVAFTAYNWLLRNVRSSLATSYAYVNPLVAVAIGNVLGGERVTSMTLAAAAVSLAGVALIARRKRG